MFAESPIRGQNKHCLEFLVSIYVEFLIPAIPKLQTKNNILLLFLWQIKKAQDQSLKLYYIVWCIHKSGCLEVIFWINAQVFSHGGMQIKKIKWLSSNTYLLSEHIPELRSVPFR